MDNRKEKGNKDEDLSSDDDIQDKKKQKTEGENSDEEEEEEEPNAMFQQLFSMFGPGSMRTSDNAQLVDNLKHKQLFKNPRVEEALLQIPRGSFVPKEMQAEAYMDYPLRIASLAFNISAPHMYAICLQNLDIQPGDHFLDIGSGSGHFTALGGYLVGKEGLAVGVDLRQDIIDFAESNVKKLTEETGLDLSNVKFYVRNCFLPTMQSQKYDRIHAGACCPAAQTESLLKLLKNGGILVTPHGDQLTKITKDSKGEVKMEKLLSVRYSDLIVPSEAEIKEALRQLEREKATTIIVPPCTYKEDFAKLLNNPSMSDVTFKVEGKEVFGHRIILAARSEHFKAMFFGGLRESTESMVTLSETPYDIFLACLSHIYTGDVKINTPDEAIEMLSAANYFKLDRLKAICEDIIKDSIEIENAAYILQVGSRHEAWQLKSYCLDFVMQHYEEVSQTKCFEDLDKPLLLEVTREACKLAKNN